MGASLMPSYFNAVVDLHIAISPKTDLSRSAGAVVGFFWALWALFQQLFQTLGWYKVLHRDSYYNDAMNCANDIKGCTVKYEGYFTVERYPYYLAHKAAGVSWMTIEHNSQIAWNGKFQRWNYGTNEANGLIYGELQPPLYNLGNIRFPVAVFYTTEQYKGDIDEYLLDP
jgi:hypothetical protein